MAELDINGPIDFSSAERNKRLYERLINEGLVVYPVLLDTGHPDVIVIDHLIVSVSLPRQDDFRGKDNNHPFRHCSSN